MEWGVREEKKKNVSIKIEQKLSRRHVLREESGRGRRKH